MSDKMAQFEEQYTPPLAQKKGRAISQQTRSNMKKRTNMRLSHRKWRTVRLKNGQKLFKKQQHS
jgi:hypothetical protein